MTFKFKVPNKTWAKINTPGFPSLAPTDQPEQLTGQVMQMDASAPEERLARALDEVGIPYLFRYVVGAPKGMPGWKELDFVIQTKGLLYALEVDTAFTHRAKENADVLHDAIVLNDFQLKTMGLMYPKVFHADGDTELSTRENAKQYVKQQFGK